MTQGDLIKAVQERVDKGVHARSIPFDWQGQRYWIKIAIKTQKNRWHRIQNLAAVVLRCALLRATVSYAQDKGLHAEASRLQRVARRGVKVPQVIAQRPGWLLLEDIGVSLFAKLNELDREVREPLLLKGVAALANLHGLGGWHGTGQLRDMVLCPDGTIGFIDFEENVGEAMVPAAAQARDILRFLISAVRFDAGDGRLLHRIMDVYIQNAPQDVVPEIRAVLRLAKPLGSILGPFQKKLGRDLRHALLVIRALDKVSAT